MNAARPIAWLTGDENWVEREFESAVAGTMNVGDVFPIHYPKRRAPLPLHRSSLYRALQLIAGFAHLQDWIVEMYFETGWVSLLGTDWGFERGNLGKKRKTASTADGHLELEAVNESTLARERLLASVSVRRQMQKVYSDIDLGEQWTRRPQKAR